MRPTLHAQNFRIHFLKKSLTSRILVALILTNLVLLLVLGWLIIRDSAATLTKEIINYTSKVMDQACNNLDFNFEDIKTPFALLTDNSSVVACLDYYPRMSWIERLEHDRRIHEIATNINTFKPLISDILIIGKNGYINNLSENRSSLSWNYDFWKQPWYRKAISPDTPERLRYLGLHYQDYYIRSLTYKFMKPTFSMAIPVYNNNSAITGAVICNFDIDRLNNIMMQSNYERSGQILLLDKTGTIIAHKNKKLIGKPFHPPGYHQLSRRAGHFVTTIQGKESLLIYRTSKITAWKIVSYIPLQEIRNHSGQLKKDIMQIVLLGVFLNGVICIVIALHAGKPLQRLIAAIDNVGSDNLQLPQIDFQYSELNFVGSKFRELLERINTLIQENYTTQVCLKEAELNALQTQINPHFIFNTLQLLQTQILYGRFAESNQIILSLSSMLRYAVYEAHALVPIQTEIAYIKDYLSIYSRKFQDKLQVEYTVPAELESYLIPKLLLQPIVENTLKHGFNESPDHGRIQIAVQKSPTGILIAVTDNGSGIEPGKLCVLQDELRRAIPRDPAEKENHIGLTNIQQRIRLKYGDGYGLTIASEKGVYTRVDLTIPAQEKEETH